MAGPEARIRDRYRREATRLGYLVLVLHGSAYSGPGRADTLTLAHGDWIAIEFKTETGKATKMQLEFLRAVRDAEGYGFIARQASSALRAVELITHGHLPYEEKLMDDDFELDLSFLDEVETTPAVAGGIHFGPLTVVTPGLLAGENLPAPEVKLTQRRGRKPRVTDAEAKWALKAMEQQNGEIDPVQITDLVRQAQKTAPSALEYDSLTQAIKALIWSVDALREELANHRLVAAGE